jgi:hypothetical protein
MKDTFDQYKWFKNQYLNENETAGIMNMQEWIQETHPQIYLSDSISYDDLVYVMETWTSYIKQ